MNELFDRLVARATASSRWANRSGRRTDCVVISTSEANGDIILQAPEVPTYEWLYLNLCVQLE